MVIFPFNFKVLDLATYEARQRDYASRGQKHFYFMTLNGGEVWPASFTSWLHNSRIFCLLWIFHPYLSRILCSSMFMYSLTKMYSSELGGHCNERDYDLYVGVQTYQIWTRDGIYHNHTHLPIGMWIWFRKENPNSYLPILDTDTYQIWGKQIWL